jgi:hypothetical protein
MKNERMKINGMTIEELSHATGIPLSTLYGRIQKNYPLEKVLCTQRVNKRNKPAKTIPQPATTEHPAPAITHEIARQLAPKARLFCGVAYTQGSQYDTQHA